MIDMMQKNGTACGKIILSGEYAVVFGYPGIALPSAEKITVTLAENAGESLDVRWSGVEGDSTWNEYVRTIVSLLETERKPIRGTLTIEGGIPLQKGMGSSTAMVIALSRCVLGHDCRDEALKIEDIVNPGHSGMDFAVIWEQQSVLFRQKEPLQHIALPQNFLLNSHLIDTGEPGEPTKELVAWIRSRTEEPAIAAALTMIGGCSERIMAGEPIKTVMRDHHRAQVALGVVTPEAQKIIADIEAEGGAAKVLGAGARTGGGGMVLRIS